MKREDMTPEEYMARSIEILEGCGKHFKERADTAMATALLVDEFEDYWPMTVRAFYYQAVSKLLIKNNKEQYNRFSEILVVLRRKGIVPWEAVIDRTRSVSSLRGRPDVTSYVEAQTTGLFAPNWYQRRYIIGQEVYVEITTEKDALAALVQQAATRYSTAVVVAKGQISASFLYDMSERFADAADEGLEPILLHFGDLDPTGVQVPLSIGNGLRKHHGVDVDVRQVSLTPEQCVEYALLQSPDAAKAKDPNIKRWYARFGDQAPTELDALHPEELKQLVMDTLEGVYDMELFKEQQEIEKEERIMLKGMRKDTLRYLKKQYPDYMKYS